MELSRRAEDREERKRLPMWYRAVSLALTLLTLAALCFSCALAIMARMGEDGNGAFGHRIMKVSSESMLPTFSQGDVLLFSAYDKEGLEEGEIVLFKAPYGAFEGRYITHRVVEAVMTEEGRTYRTRADAAGLDTWTLTDEDIVGVFEKKMPLVTDVSRYISSSAGMMLVVGLPVILFVAVILADSLLSKKLAAAAPSEKKESGEDASLSE